MWTCVVLATLSTPASKKSLIPVVVLIVSPSVSVAVSLVPRKKVNSLFQAAFEQRVKTPGMKIPGVFLCLLLSLPAFADCGHPSGALLKVARVSDGDTIKLEDGRSVRVLGMNAPEVARGKISAQPLAREARAAAQAFVQRAGGRVRLGFERERKDRYGRLLAHVYDASGRSLASDLLQKGLALQIAVPPNVEQAKCLLTFEKRARARGVGIWRDSYWSAYPIKFLKPGDTGFRHLKGKVTAVDVNSSVWLEFEGNLVVRIAKNDWPQFGYSKQDWLSLLGKTIEVRGWVVMRNGKSTQTRRALKPLILQLRSSAALHVSTS